MNFSKKVKVESINHSAEQLVEFEVPRLNNWTVNQSRVSRSYSMGSSGTVTSFKVSQDGNVPDEITTSIQGNVTDVLQIQPSFQVLPRIPKTLKLVYDIPETYETGNFTGSIVFNGSNLSRTVNISLELSDDQDPEIKLTEFPDVEATQQVDFKVRAVDNRKVQKVTGKVYKINSSGNNTTEEQVSEFFFKNTGEDVFKHVYDETGEEGNYSITVTAFDSSGNNDSIQGSFQVVPLDVVNVYNSNFNYGKIIHGEGKNRTILELEEKEEVRLGFHKLIPRSFVNESQIGIVHEDWSEPHLFDRLGDTIKLRETGNYSLYVKPGEGENHTEFNGEIDIITPEKHVSEPNIFFGGTGVQGFATPTRFSAAGLEGRAYYSDFENGVPTEKAVIVRGDASDCRGVDRMTDCIQNLNLDKVKDLSQQVQQLSGRVHPGWKYLSGILFFGMILNRYSSKIRWKFGGFLQTDALVNYKKVAQERSKDDFEIENLNHESETSLR
jgi:hypothetical protein